MMNKATARRTVMDIPALSPADRLFEWDLRAFVVGVALGKDADIVGLVVSFDEIVMLAEGGGPLVLTREED